MLAEQNIYNKINGSSIDDPMSIYTMYMKTL